MANGAVEILDLQIDDTPRRRERQSDVGMQGPELRQPRQQPVRRQGGDRADAQLSASAPDRFDRGLDAVEGVAHRRDESAAIIGQRDVAALLLDEGDAELALEICDPMRQGRTADPRTSAAAVRLPLCDSRASACNPLSDGSMTGPHRLVTTGEIISRFDSAANCYR